MSNLCPRCSSPLPAEDINVAADTALCRKCGSAFSFSELLHYARDFNTIEPPSGISYEEAPGGFIVTVTTRSWAALYVVPFAAVWGGVVLRTFGTQIREGQSDGTLLLLGITFLLAAASIIYTALMLSIGVVKVRRDGDDGAVFSGIGPFGWTRRFQWSKIVSVLETDANYFSRGGRQTYHMAEINLAGASGPRQIHFGAMLSEERRRYLIWIIRKQITR